MSARCWPRAETSAGLGKAVPIQRGWAFSPGSGWTLLHRAVVRKAQRIGGSQGGARVQPLLPRRGRSVSGNRKVGAQDPPFRSPPCALLSLCFRLLPIRWAQRVPQSTPLSWRCCLRLAVLSEPLLMALLESGVCVRVREGWGRGRGREGGGEGEGGARKAENRGKNRQARPLSIFLIT